jgi:hypothetical protein
VIALLVGQHAKLVVVAGHRSLVAEPLIDAQRLLECRVSLLEVAARRGGSRKAVKRLNSERIVLLGALRLADNARVLSLRTIEVTLRARQIPEVQRSSKRRRVVRS